MIPGFGPTAGGAIAGHMGVDKIAFTGSTEVLLEIHAKNCCSFSRNSKGDVMNDDGCWMLYDGGNVDDGGV